MQPLPRKRRHSLADNFANSAFGSPARGCDATKSNNSLCHRGRSDTANSHTDTFGDV